MYKQWLHQDIRTFFTSKEIMFYLTDWLQSLTLASVILNIEWLIAWLVFNANFSNISATS